MRRGNVVCTHVAHDWRRTNEGGWRASFKRVDKRRRPSVAVEVVWCARCDACVDMPVELAASLPLAADHEDGCPPEGDCDARGRAVASILALAAARTPGDDDDIPF